jgi:recombination protein RecA
MSNLPTGSLALDLKLGTGGWPRGRIVEIYGPEGSGKTTLLLEAVAQAQRGGGQAAFLDADHGLDNAAAERLGINVEALSLVRSNSLEEVFAKIDEIIRRPAVEVIALDSIAALLPESHLKIADPPYRRDEEHQHKIDFYLRALLGPLSRSRATLLITNQVREKVGVMFGNPETTPWETTVLRNYASQRVELRRLAAVKDGAQVVGFEMRAKVMKNRQAAPFAQAEFEVYYATGICWESELFRLGLEAGVLAKRGGHVFLDDLGLGKGQNEVVRALEHDAELAARVREEVLERLRPSPGPPGAGEGP